MKEIKTRRDLMKVLSEGHTVEYKYENGENWITVEAFTFYINALDDALLNVYRIKPTKPSIDWSHVHPRYKYLARDDYGGIYLYEEEPYKLSRQWESRRGDACRTDNLSSVKAGDCDWQDSLVKRPDNEEK